MPADLPLRLHLASRSPRRAELLAQIGVGFERIALRNAPRKDRALDETPLAGEDALCYVERVARSKAEHGCRIVRWRRLAAQPVLAADTTLELAGEIIGKPVDEADALAILRRLSGRTHAVLTGVAVAYEGCTEYVQSISEVRFRPIEDDELRRYVHSGEPMDKAGAYAIQGRAGLFVEYIAGSYTGIMGLPVCETGELLKRFGWRF